MPSMTSPTCGDTNPGMHIWCCPADVITVAVPNTLIAVPLAAVIFRAVDFSSVPATTDVGSSVTSDPVSNKHFRHLPLTSSFRYVWPRASPESLSPFFAHATLSLSRRRCDIFLHSLAKYPGSWHMKHLSCDCRSAAGAGTGCSLGSAGALAFKHCSCR